MRIAEALLAALLAAALPHAAAAATNDAASRAALMEQGAAALARGDADAAARAYEQAASMQHEPDAELALVRSAMQAGRYRQALTYAAHIAGGHKEDADGAALYAWLLWLGGQPDAASRILAAAEPLVVGAAPLRHARRAMRDGRIMPATADGDALFALFSPVSLPALPRANPKASVVASGLLLGDGRQALAPLAPLLQARRIRVRDGLGQLRSARIARRIQPEGLALLELAEPLPAPGLFAPDGDPHAGSPAYLADHARSQGGQAAWPRLRHGFLGAPAGERGRNAIGIAPAAGAAAGGPVFNGSGGLAGIAYNAPNGSASFLSAAWLGRRLGMPLAPAAPTPAGPRIALEQVYENAMRGTLQVIAER